MSRLRQSLREYRRDNPQFVDEGASDEQIDALQERMGVEFPWAYRAFLELVGATSDICGIVTTNDQFCYDVETQTRFFHSLFPPGTEHIGATVGSYGKDTLRLASCVVICDPESGDLYFFPAEGRETNPRVYYFEHEGRTADAIEDYHNLEQFLTLTKSDC